jgi:hypothetical protein
MIRRALAAAVVFGATLTAQQRAAENAYDFGREIGGTTPFTRYEVTSLP